MKNAPSRSSEGSSPEAAGGAADLLLALARMVSCGDEPARIARLLDELADFGRGETAAIVEESRYLRQELKGERGLRLLAGDSQGMKAVRWAVQQVARTDSTVLIQGETGTGKELVARAIHQLSPRRDRLLVAVNCSALAPSVIASELFGHEAGAFTGAARRRVGRFEVAQGGSIFLDEIGDVPPETQILLLRVLQERVIERVGSNEPVAVNVRVIAATNRDLALAVQEGRFRADLFYRLNVFPIHVPPLRARPEDIPALVDHFRVHFNQRLNKQVTRVDAATIRQLQDYPWAGNVRELENLMERAMIVGSGETLHIDPSWLTVPAKTGTDGQPRQLADLERNAIVEALRKARGRIYGANGAANALGLKPSTLYGKMRKLRIERSTGS